MACELGAPFGQQFSILIPSLTALAHRWQVECVGGHTLTLPSM